MTRSTTSSIMTEAGKAKVEKQKIKAADAKQKLKDLKADLKDERLNAAADKKEVLNALKVFIGEPTNTEAANGYKKAVATHIATVKIVAKLEAKLAKAV